MTKIIYKKHEKIQLSRPFWLKFLKLATLGLPISNIELRAIGKIDVDSSGIRFSIRFSILFSFSSDVLRKAEVVDCIRLPGKGCVLSSLNCRFCFSIWWCCVLTANRFTWTGIGTTILVPELFPVWEPDAKPALTRFHFARRFWNQIFTWKRKKILRLEN